jgi:hypothetical protein
MFSASVEATPKNQAHLEAARFSPFRMTFASTEGSQTSKDKSLTQSLYEG